MVAIMTVLTRSQTKPSFGLRPLNPLNDLRQVADLIEVAFANTLDAPGQSALQELRWLNFFKPALWGMFYFSFERNDFLSGFVWEEDGRIVGNISLSQMEFGSRRWVISNLAVSPACRKRGIATSLMDASLEMVKQSNGAAVLLQVRADNDGARRLYRKYEFKDVIGTAYLQAKTVPQVANFYLPDGLRWREYRFNGQEAYQIYQLAKAATPLLAQQEWPIRQSRFWLGEDERLVRWVGKLFGGTRVGWLVEDGPQVVGMVDVQRGLFGDTHFVELIVHPNWRGVIEKPLISRAMQFLYRWRKTGVNIRPLSDHTEALAAYQEFGFQEEQTLIWMKRKM